MFHTVAISGQIMFAPSAHSWEARAAAFDAARPPGPDSEEEEDWEKVSGPAAGDLFLEELYSLHFAGKLSARSLCVLCWHASRAGAQGEVAKHGFRPDAPSGHYQRHLDAIAGISMSSQLSWRYTVSTPQHTKASCSRAAHSLAVTVPHEALNEEIISDPGLVHKIAEMRWPPGYYEHPVVRSSDRPVMPLALYLDGVPSTRRDGMLGFWI